MIKDMDLTSRNAPNLFAVQTRRHIDVISRLAGHISRISVRLSSPPAVAIHIGAKCNSQNESYLYIMLY